MSNCLKIAFGVQGDFSDSKIAKVANYHPHCTIFSDSKIAKVAPFLGEYLSLGLKYPDGIYIILVLTL